MCGRQRTIAFVLGLISTLAGLGCASTPKVETNGRGTAAEVECFDASQVRTFSPLDARFVYVRVLSDEHYVLTMDSIYPSLPLATGITISNTFRRVCSDTGAMLTWVGSEGQVSSRILHVESVASRDAALQRVEERTGRMRQR